jgi:hypothetical protein
MSYKAERNPKKTELKADEGQSTETDTPKKTPKVKKA